MKEKKSKKSPQISEKKKTRKELEEKLQTAFNNVAAEFGKTKKAKATIEKFAKQLIKKIEVETKEVAKIAKQVKEAIVEATTTEEAPKAEPKKPVVKKTPAKKA